MAVATDREYGLFIGGEPAEPASGEVTSSSSPRRASRSPARRWRARPTSTAQSRRHAPPSRTTGGSTPGTERARLLHALADAIVVNRAELAELESRDVGKAISSVKAELHQAVENFRFYASAVATISGRANPIGGSLLFYSLKEPVGVAAQIVPWNYPLMMATWKLAPALAAGCSVVLKPDPQTPLTAIRLAELAAEVGFPAGAVNVVPGDGAYDRRVPREAPGRRQGRVHRLDEDGRRDHAPRVRSGEAGHARARREEPEPRLRGADLSSALPSSAWSIFYAAGQSCEARSRMLVEKSLYDEAVSTMAEFASGSRSAIRSIQRRRWAL